MNISRTFAASAGAMAIAVAFAASPAMAQIKTFHVGDGNTGDDWECVHVTSAAQYVSSGTSEAEARDKLAGAGYMSPISCRHDAQSSDSNDDGGSSNQ